MVKTTFLFTIIYCMIYIRNHLYYKKQIGEIYNSLEIINIKIENINKFINRRKVSFEIKTS